MIYTVADIEAAVSPLRLGPGDRLTPLAKDRAAERGIIVEVHEVSPSQARTPAPAPARAAGPALYGTAFTVPAGARRAPPTLPLPPSGAMYRRGAPLEAGSSGRAAGANRSGRTRAVSAAVVGAGHVGAMTAFRLAETDLFERIRLIDIVPGLAAGLALDLWHGAGLCDFTTRVEGTEDLAGLAGADYVVVTAGRARQPGMSRTDLTAINADIIGSVAEAIRRHAPGAVVIVVTNPLEEMTHLTERGSGLVPERVIGMAGVLDTARFCSLVGLTGKARPADVQAYALGSHGPEMVIPLSQAFVGRTPLTQLLEPATLAGIVERTRDSGAEVVALLQKGSAYFSPAESVATMVRAMVADSGDVLTACVRSRGAYGLADTRVGLPVRLGPGGVKEIVALALDPDEQQALRDAAERIASRIQELG